MLSERNEPFVLEINTIPGMTEASLLPEAAAVAGITYPELCARIIELSLAARPRKNESESEQKSAARRQPPGFDSRASAGSNTCSTSKSGRAAPRIIATAAFWSSSRRSCS